MKTANDGLSPLGRYWQGSLIRCALEATSQETVTVCAGCHLMARLLPLAHAVILDYLFQKTDLLGPTGSEVSREPHRMELKIP